MLKSLIVGKFMFLFFFHLIPIFVIFCVLSVNLVHCLFWLTGSFILSSLFLLFLGVEWVSAIIILIYAGAIAILFMISLMMVNPSMTGRPLSWSSVFKNPWIAQGLCLILLMIWIKNFIFGGGSSCQLINNTKIWSNMLTETNEIKVILNFLFNFNLWAIVLSIITLLVPMLGVLIFISN